MKVGLVLGNGGPRGLAHIGVMKVLLRNGVNLRIGSKIVIPAKIAPYFKVGKELKDAVK
jgi:predicted acylesterase/phospholipase RssA